MRLCVFCGSAPGARPAFADAARTIGREIGRRGWTLVSGGGRVGLMGTLADAVLQAGGRAVGVIPRFLYEREVGHEGLASLEIVESFAVRKERMGQLADAYLSLPGGVGTLDELFEAWSWSQAGLQNKPNGLLNVEGYYDELLRFLDRAVEDGLLKPAARRQLIAGTEPCGLLDALFAASPAAVRP